VISKYLAIFTVVIENAWWLRFDRATSRIRLSIKILGAGDPDTESMSPLFENSIFRADISFFTRTL